MLHASLNAFLARAPDVAMAAAIRDDEVDQLYDQVFCELLTYMLEDSRNIGRATFLLWVTHNLECIADRVTNISEWVVFIITGKLEEMDGGWKGEATSSSQ